MHDLAFADTARPTPVRVLGLTLRDYSIGHELFLLRERNPFLCATRDEFNQFPPHEQVYAIKRAALICSRPWRLNVGAELGTYKEPHLRLWAWAIRWELHNVPLAIADFRNYLAEACKLLPLLSSSVPEDAEAYEIANKGEKLGSGRALGSPFMAQLMVYLAKMPHPERFVGPEDHPIYDFPYNLGANLYFTQLEQEGGVYVENQEEAWVRERMAQERAEAARERAEAEKANETAKEDAPCRE